LTRFDVGSDAHPNASDHGAVYDTLRRAAGVSTEAFPETVTDESMPITYVIDRDASLMTTRARGHITPAALYEYLDAIIDDPANEQCDELLILEDVDIQSISAADIRALARRSAELSQDDGFRVAVVASRDADFGMTRMSQTLRELGEKRMAVFRSLGAACDWLGVTRP